MHNIKKRTFNAGFFIVKFIVADKVIPENLLNKS